MLSYAHLEATLVSHLNVAPEHRTKFSMRIKQFQRLHWPRGVNTGGKSRVAYNAAQLLELALAFELVQLGLPPKRARELVESWWDDLRQAFLRARDNSFPIIFAFIQGDFAGLLAAPMAGARSDGVAVIGTDPNDDADQMRQTLLVLSQSRACLINMKAVLRGLTRGLEQAQVESALLWSQTEAWRAEFGDLTNSSRWQMN